MFENYFIILQHQFMLPHHQLLHSTMNTFQKLRFKFLTLLWLDSDREESRNPKVPLTLSITYAVQECFLSINITKVDTQFVFLEQSFIVFFNKISNISCDNALNIKSIVGWRTIHLRKRDFPDLPLNEKNHKIYEFHSY